MLQEQKHRSVSDGQRGDSFNDRQPQMHQQQHQQHPQQAQQDAQSVSGETDPYAAYGGYQNYVALWYSSLQANQGQQDQSLQGPPGS